MRRRTFSPHAWGWTVLDPCPNIPHDVLPTRVGVDRLSKRRPLLGMCSPHTRGGGPVPWELCSLTSKFSPHAWGWTDAKVGILPRTNVLPTRVGVDRSCEWRLEHRAMFSPHAWGWTDGAVGIEGSPYVLPTRVGVDRSKSSPHTRGGGPFNSPKISSYHRSPHTRGGGPWRLTYGFQRPSFSPRVWGWTEHA